MTAHYKSAVRDKLLNGAVVINTVSTVKETSNNVFSRYVVLDTCPGDMSRMETATGGDPIVEICNQIVVEAHDNTTVEDSMGSKAAVVLTVSAVE